MFCYYNLYGVFCVLKEFVHRNKNLFDSELVFVVYFYFCLLYLLGRSSVRNLREINLAWLIKNYEIRNGNGSSNLEELLECQNDSNMICEPI